MVTSNMEPFRHIEPRHFFTFHFTVEQTTITSMHLIIAMKFFAMRCFVFLTILSLPSLALSEPFSLPETAQEWSQRGDTFNEWLAQKQFEKIIAQEPPLRSTLLEAPPRHYLATICLARALSQLTQDSQAIEYYEQALRQRCLEHNVWLYSKSVRAAGQAERGLQFLRDLKTEFPDLDPAHEQVLEFWSLISQGDAFYHKGQRLQAKTSYQKAKAIYTTLPSDDRRRKQWMQRIQPLMQEYSYYKLYADEDGWKRHHYLTASFLLQKLDLLSSEVPKPAGAIHYRVAVLVIRKTKLTFQESDGVFRSETNLLDDRELDAYRKAWRFSTDAIQYYSRGQLVISSQWIDLPEATLTRLKSSQYKGLLDVRHLDPAAIVPRQDNLFKKLVRRFDCVVFVWDRGTAAKAFGGGPVALPYEDRTLPKRGGILSMPKTSTLCMHEFLHNMTPREGIPSVHGIRGEWQQQLPQFRGNTEGQWYCFLTANISDWRPYKYIP